MLTTQRYDDLPFESLQVHPDVSNAPEATYRVSSEDLLALVLVIEGKRHEDHHLDRARRAFPAIVGA